MKFNRKNLYRKQLAELEMENEKLKSLLKAYDENGRMKAIDETLELKKRYEDLIREVSDVKSEYEKLLKAQLKISREYQDAMNQAIRDI